MSRFHNVVGGAIAGDILAHICLGTQFNIIDIIIIPISVLIVIWVFNLWDRIS